MVKEKLHQTRIYDKEGFRKRAACVCVRNDSESEVLLVTSSRSPDHWVVPGGGLEPHEDPESAASREALEEAGIRGQLGRCLGVFENSERKHRTFVYVFMVKEELPYWEEALKIGRRRKWFSVREAKHVLDLYRPLQTVYLNTLKACRS
ncbi:diphosphoinositol polyphosphate phosphohydrolase 1-like [Gordionus sp. m RMFG-2023]|uniref:diphosphoinositol polyphosphate phosphohydrolase 1-like n=1 Tax=Gordionus sp. m RMFG-2023 TaxID=3053472 RepID=UPI0031FCED8D